MKKYMVLKVGVRDNDTGSIVSKSSENPQWVKYLKWVEEGNDPIPIQPGPEYILDESDQWVCDLGPIKTAKKAALSAECRTRITLGGVSSSALGSPHTYGCRESDQINARSAYTLAVAMGGARSIVCDGGSGFGPRQHTEAQAVAVLDVMFRHVESRRVRLIEKTGEVDAIQAGSYATPQEAIDAIQAVTW